jgi:hypothetical protein
MDDLIPYVEALSESWLCFHGLVDDRLLHEASEQQIPEQAHQG